MPAFSPTIGKFGDVTPRGKPWSLWYKRNKAKLWPYALGLLFVALLVSGWWVWQGQMVPAPGGVLDEGMIGQPQRLNPLYSSSNDIDSEITPLIYRGLLDYNDDFSLVNDLASSVSVNEQGTVFDITLGDHTWHDGAPVTSSDVAFTIKTTQDPHYVGSWSGSFTGVDIAIHDASSLTLTLEEPYAPFEHNLVIGLLPEHILGGKTIEQIATDPFNLAPIGTGVLRHHSTQIDQEDDDVASIKFDLTSGHIDAVEYHFYAAYHEAFTDFKLGKLDTLGTLYTESLSELDDFSHHQESAVVTGQTYGLYFNLIQDSVKDSRVREAMTRALDKNKLISDVFDSHATPMNNVYPVGSWAYSDLHESMGYNLEKAQEVWSDIENKPDSIRLLVPDRPIHATLAEHLAKSWSALGLTINVSTSDGATLAQTVQSGQGYDVVLLGEKMRPDPDRYSNWHSTQLPPDGLNVSRLESDRIDKALEDARVLLDQEERKVKYATFQDYLSREQPVIWLYQPHYVYMWGSKVKDVSLTSMWSESDRYNTISDWYVNQRRRSN